MKYQVVQFIFLMMLISCDISKKEIRDYPIEPVNIRVVQLTDKFWLPKIQTIQNTTIAYAFDKCNKEGRMENFLIAGSKMEGETRGEMPFDDTDLYKIIEGASYSLISNPDKQLDDYLDSIIAIIKTGQEKDGYLTTWKTINPERSPASWAPPGDRWENLASSHELYNSGHLFEAAAAHYNATGKTNFLNIAIKNADLLVETFGEDKNQQVPGHQIVETGLIKLYKITNEKKYLELAKHFLDQRGHPELRELFGSYNQDHKPVTEQDEVVGHAVRAVYMYAGMTDIAAIYNDHAYWKAVNTLWNNMVYKKMYITGGIGARHEGESFGENYELPNLTAYSETCAAIGSVYWSHRMFLNTGNVKYYDVIERTLYNGIISGISLDGDEFFYPNPLESDGKYDFNKGSCTRQPWFDCSCCPTNLIRFIPSVPDLIYASNRDTLYINLFISNEANISFNYNTVQVIQKTEYPWGGQIKITITPEIPESFTVKIRIPGWARNEAVPGDLYSYLEKNWDQVEIMINGIEEDIQYDDGYAEITREWEQGDVIDLQLPVKIQRVITNEEVKENKDLVAMEYGPIVFCGEEADNKLDISQIIIPDDLELKIEKPSELLCGVNVLVGNVPENNTKIILIPYYAWSNRGVGKMKVWFPRK